MNTKDSRPAAAACAATALARFPVDAHAIVPNPSSRARASATETTRSLNEWAEATLAHVARIQRVLGLAFLATKRHWRHMKKPPPGSVVGGNCDAAISTSPRLVVGA